MRNSTLLSGTFSRSMNINQVPFVRTSERGTARALLLLCAGCILLGSLAHTVPGFVLMSNEVDNLVLRFLPHNIDSEQLVTLKDEDAELQIASPNEPGTSASHSSKCRHRSRTRRLRGSKTACTWSKGSTLSSSDSPCACCVVPIQVGLELGVSQNTFFPLVIELAKEIADGNLLQRRQVVIGKTRAVGSNKTYVGVKLMPLGTGFDNGTAQLIAERFWTKQVHINETLFGNCSVISVDYPGLSDAPASAPLGSSPSPDTGTR